MEFLVDFLVGPTQNILPKLPATPHGKYFRERAPGSQEFFSGGARLLHLREQTELRFHRIPRLEKSPKISNSKDIPKILHLPGWGLIHCSLDKEQETFPSPQMPHSRVMAKAAMIAGGSDVQVSSEKRLG